MEISNEQNGAYAGSDRLSDLPDCLLHTILSLLQSRQVVQTSLLSRRWRHLWLSAPGLDIYRLLAYWTFELGRPSCYYRWSWRRSNSVDERLHWHEFEDFVNNLLLHNSTRLLVLHTLIDGFRKFEFKKTEFDKFVIDDGTARGMLKWIRGALDCAPAVLVVHYGASIQLPPSASGTRRLTKLCLDQVTLHGGFEQQISTGLPVLEDLSFRNSDLSRLSRIMSDTLKNLTLDCCKKTGDSLAIAAPRLTSLHFSILFYNHASYIVAEAPSLVEASICLVKKPKQKSCHWELGSKPDMSMLRGISKLLRSLINSSVSSLKLAGFPKLLVGDKDLTFPVPHSDGIFEAKHIWNMMKSDKFVLSPMLQWILEEERNKLPLFANLQTLMLDNCEIGHNIQVLWCFLHNTPVLEILTLNNCKFSNGVVLGKSSLKPLASNISDMPPELKLLEIRYIDKEDHELKHQGIQPIEKILSMIRRKLPATSMIRATKVSRKKRAN